MNDTRCIHCNRPLEQHWTGSEGAFCDAADLPDYKLFGNRVSEQRYESKPQQAKDFQLCEN